MSECKICTISEKGGLKKIYEDVKVIVALSPEPISKGHVLVIPKKHYPIIEQIPDYEVAYMFNIANKISIFLFESLKVQGTNLFVENGIAAGQKYSHFMIHIIPRMPNDGINFEWVPKQMNEEEMSTIELKIKEQISVVGNFEEEKKEPINLDNKIKTISAFSDKEDYLIKSLRKIP
jgi:histidine triad (HIT) family protein